MHATLLVNILPGRTSLTSPSLATQVAHLVGIIPGTDLHHVLQAVLMAGQGALHMRPQPLG